MTIKDANECCNSIVVIIRIVEQNWLRKRVMNAVTVTVSPLALDRNCYDRFGCSYCYCCAKADETETNGWDGYCSKTALFQTIIEYGDH